MTAKNEASRWFVLQASDPVTGCPMLETRFLASNLAELRRIVGSSESGDPDFNWGYPLDARQLSEIEARFDARFAKGDHEVMLVPWHSLREIPYLVHTGFELALMLEGRKPFAKFSHVYPSDWLDLSGAT